jgi:hypothetical protein
MKNWLKKYFIPHERNDYKPHILRREAMLFMLGILFLAEIFFLVQVYVLFPNIKFFAEILKNVLIEETNINRLANNLASLEINPLLTGAAQAKAEDMASKGYFAHISPQGITPWYWIERVGYEYSYAGENLAINFSDSKDAIEAWMNSAAHRENILSNHFTETGIGVAKGIYEDKETIFIVQMFGRPVQEMAPIISQPIASQNTASQVATGQPAISEEVLPAETAIVKSESKENPSFSALVGELVAAPRLRTETLYLIVLGIVIMALILNILIRAKVQHPRIIFNGIILILIINSVLLINHYLISANSRLF